MHTGPSCNEVPRMSCRRGKGICGSSRGRGETPPPTYDEALLISQASNTPVPLYIALSSPSPSPQPPTVTNLNDEASSNSLHGTSIVMTQDNLRSPLPELDGQRSSSPEPLSAVAKGRNPEHLSGINLLECFSIADASVEGHNSSSIQKNKIVMPSILGAEDKTIHQQQNDAT